MGEEGSVGNTGCVVIRIFGWQDKEVVALAKAEEEDRGEYGSE